MLIELTDTDGNKCAIDPSLIVLMSKSHYREGLGEYGTSICLEKEGFNCTVKESVSEVVAKVNAALGFKGPIIHYGLNPGSKEGAKSVAQEGFCAYQCSDGGSIIYMANGERLIPQSEVDRIVKEKLKEFLTKGVGGSDEYSLANFQGIYEYVMKMSATPTHQSHQWAKAHRSRIEEATR